MKTKITPADVDKAIVDSRYILLPDRRTTICMLTLVNGFTVTGESACVDISNFEVAIGEEVARKNAESKVWMLLGYDLATKLKEEQTRSRA